MPSPHNHWPPTGSRPYVRSGAWLDALVHAATRVVARHVDRAR